MTQGGAWKFRSKEAFWGTGMSINICRRGFGRSLAVVILLTLGGCNQPDLSMGGPGLSGANSAGPLTQSASAAAQLELATRLVAGRGVEKNMPAGAALIEHLAQSGNPVAQFLIGEYYFSGTGVEKKPELTASWLQKAADQNSTLAQAELAVLYIRGVGVTQDYGHAFRLAKAAADHGNAEAEDALGMIYANGWGVNADSQEAVNWFTKSASRKSSPGMLHLGESYRDAKGVVADKVAAYAWFSLSVANAQSASQRSAAEKSRDDLALILLPDDLALAQQLATSWKPGDNIAAQHAALAASPSRSEAGLVASGTNDAGKSGPVFNSAASTPSNQAADVPIVVKLQTFDYLVNPDGGSKLTVHSEIEIKKEAALKDYGQDPLQFSESLDSVDVLDAYTLKPDGRKLRVDRSAIYTQLVPGAPTAPMFDDQRQKVIVFPALEVGDVMVETVTYTRKPSLPGFFSISFPFSRTVAYQDVRVNITTPKTMPLVTETHDLKLDQHSAGDQIVYEWRYSNLNPLPENTIALDPRDRWPRLFASSYKSYDAFARAYAILIEPKSAVTPAIQKLANDITAGQGDRRRQAEAIYNWVGRHIRYVAIEVGRGAIIPHDAGTVLANGYGDCKDHSILFSALLKAKGIPSNVVLINLGTSYSLASPPSYGTLNHAITYLPEFNLYADTTAGIAPFGTLPFQEYGKPVVHAISSPGALHRTPVLSADAASLTLKTTARLNPDGKIIGDSEAASEGPFSVDLRNQAIAIQSAGAEQAAKMVLRSKNYEGTGKFDVASPFEPTQAYRLTGHFELNPDPQIFSGNSFYIPTGLAIGPRPGDFLAGNFTFRDPRGDEPTPCYSGHEVEQLSLELPDGKQLRELPKGTEIRDKYLHYKSEWSLTGHTVTVRREFSSAIDQPVCIGEARLTAAKALNDIRKDYYTPIAIAGN